MSVRVGFIGLGDMGKAMASNLAPKGFDALVYDLDPFADYDGPLTSDRGEVEAKRQPGLAAREREVDEQVIEVNKDRLRGLSVEATHRGQRGP